MKRETLEDYIKAIFAICRTNERATTNAIAQRMDVSAASANSAVQKLTEMGLLAYEKYYGATLTEAGRKMAIEVIRHHRLIESYLYEAMGVPWHKVHEEADRWEHVLSEEMEARMDELLGFPKKDPHGSPIPGPDLNMPESVGMPLAECVAGKQYCVERVRDSNSNILEYLGARGLYPNTCFVLEHAEPFGGSLTLRIDNEQEQVYVGRDAARNMYVTEVQS